MKIFNVKKIGGTILCYLIICAIYGQSPSKKQYVLEAEKQFNEKNYYGALHFYNEALEFEPIDPQILYKSAESARLFNAYSLAASKYKYLIDSLKDNSQPVSLFWLAHMYQRMGKYDEAKRYYGIYASEYGGIDSFYTAKTKKELASIDFALSKVSKPVSKYKFERLSENINSPSSEVSGMVHNDELYFSSMRFLESKPEVKPAREISKILKMSGDSTIALVPGYINERDQLVSNASINPDGTLIYYTVCEYVNGSDIRCEIYKSNIDKKGVLSNEVKLPDPINIVGYTATQPHVTIDKSSGKEILYFVSDRPGGMGNLDIWYSLIDAKFGYSEPINVTSINTSDNEISPFYNRATDFMYFSSDGREGLGGYDIYKTGKTNESFGSVLHTGVPLNSSYNDIYYYEKEDGSTAFLSSNREGSSYLESHYESCCYDIYKMNILKIDLDLNALTFDKLTSRPLKNATVILIDQTTGQEIARFRNDDGNEHVFPLNIDRSYLIIAERENYYSDTIALSTIGVEKSEAIIKKLFLSTDKILLDVFTFTTIGKLPLKGVTVILKNLTDPSKKDIIETYPISNEFNFMLTQGDMYKVTATKDGFTTAEELIDTRPMDKSTLIRRDLYLDKFILQELLPISLFFDNDLPDIASKNTDTKAIYGNLVSSYTKRKEEYKSRFAGSLSGNEKLQTIENYEIFFEGAVKGGYDKFKMFLDNLLFELQAGNKVELILKGYASPRADSKYNLALGQRRVNSVKNEMIYHGNEELKFYFLSGQLSITDISFGKELAPSDVEGDIRDERNSIYNLKAANERRVEILRASRNNNLK